MPALERSLNEIIRRHAVLRTAFALVDGVPMQRIAQSLHLRLEPEDLTSVPADTREATLRERVAEAVAAPWSLEHGPVIRARLWRLSHHEHQLLVSMHHIVSDGWSQGVLIRELTALYDAFVNDRPSPLPELPIQYADYSVWQHEWMRSAEFARQLAYWRSTLQDPPTLQLPQVRQGDAARPAGIHKWFFLSPELTRGLRELCQREGVTLYMALLAAVSVLLARYSRQTDVVVGSPIANRDRPELEGLIGSFMNPLPIRTDVGGDPTFREVIRRARQSALGAFANQNVPFDVLVRTLHARREPTNSPLFQAMFLLQNVGLQSFELSASGAAAKSFTALDTLTLPPDSERPGDLMYPLAVQMLEIGATIGGCVEYASDYGAYMTNFPDHLRTLLGAVVAHPETRVSELPILTTRERALLFDEWNHDVRPTSGLPAHKLFEREAAAHPDRTAVVAGESRLTYGELNVRANAIARALRARGVGPEVRVGILIDRTVDMVACVVGVMKAGGAYVPLDAAYPASRLQYIAQNSGIRALITTRALSDRLDDITGEGTSRFSLLLVDEVPRDGTAENVDGGAASTNLAYVIYTSGSTGLPKGTMVDHASLTNAYERWEDAYGLRGLRVHLQMASLSFDVCTGDIVRALCSGGALVVAPQEALFTPPALFTLIERHRVDAAEFVPVVLRDLVNYAEANHLRFSSLKLLVAGSDSWYTHEYQRISRLAGAGCRVVNSYGLTEATIDSTFFAGPVTPGLEDALVPLGRAFANTELLVLDAHLQPAPVGIPGELCVAGIALARGYLDRPDLTAERFVPHPFSRTPGARLYRTGDLARYRPDGTLELLGRIDNQVKLRGFRIELSEIESVLRAHDGVLEATAVIREDEPGDRRLVAYVVLGETDVPAAELRASARNRLPEYMVPSAIVFLPALPLTPNGKIDRVALPAPDGARQLDQAFVSPRTAVERQLVTIWQDVLRVDQVGVTDNFFDLGGHSLLLVQLHARIAARLQAELTVLDLFRFPTIASLAAHLADVSSESVLTVSAQRRADQRRAMNRQRHAARAPRDTA